MCIFVSPKNRPTSVLAALLNTAEEVALQGNFRNAVHGMICNACQHVAQVRFLRIEAIRTHVRLET
jgi:hypothetical protein